MGSDCTSTIALFLMALGAVISAIFYHHLLMVRNGLPQDMAYANKLDNYQPKIYSTEPNEYRFAMIADLDKESKYKDEFKWKSYIIVSC